jgi:hypothetical protein
VKCPRCQGENPDPTFTANRGHIAELAAKSCIPTMYEAREFVVAGGLVSYAALAEELADIRPIRVCALGQLAYEGLRELDPSLPAKARPTDGIRIAMKVDKQEYLLLYTAFPSRAPAGPKNPTALWEFTRPHLKDFLPTSSHPS